MQALLPIMFGLTLIAAGIALWIRRRSVSAQWEGSPTLVVLLATSGVFLTSQYGSEMLSWGLWSITGLWNLEDFIGHLVLLATCATVVYTFLIRFGDDAHLHNIFTQRVLIPLTLAIPMLLAFFIWGCCGETYEPLFDTAADPCWQRKVYWTLFTGAVIYLLAFALYLLLLLRRHERSVIIDMYIVTLILVMLGFILNGFVVLTSAEIRVAARSVGYAGVTMWCITAAYSWHRKAQRQLRSAPHGVAK